MNGYRFVLLLAVALLVIGLGCSSDEDGATSQTDAASDQTPVEDMSDSAQMQYAINNMIQRVAYGDKSGMWENEFSYLRDGETFEHYRTTHSMVTFARKDTLDSVQIVEVDMYKPDSAVTTARLHFTGPTGISSTIENPITFYWRRGKWIKPTVSAYPNQKEYDDIVRRADSAAKAEAEASGN